MGKIWEFWCGKSGDLGMGKFWGSRCGKNRGHPRNVGIVALNRVGIYGNVAV